MFSSGLFSLPQGGPPSSGLLQIALKLWDSSRLLQDSFLRVVSLTLGPPQDFCRTSAQPSKCCAPVYSLLGCPLCLKVVHLLLVFFRLHSSFGTPQDSCRTASSGLSNQHWTPAQLPQGCLTSTGPLLSFLKVVLSLLAIDTVNSLGHNS